jgi:hypothetical protein
MRRRLLLKRDPIIVVVDMSVMPTQFILTMDMVTVVGIGKEKETDLMRDRTCGVRLGIF